MSVRIKAVVYRFVKELQEALDADIQDRIMKEREMQRYIQEIQERGVGERWRRERSKPKSQKGRHWRERNRSTPTWGRAEDLPSSPSRSLASRSLRR
ncbi:hypothetical protein GUJ93_ZPchr0006g45967 [Zizania palustris]|uniref:Uncharacterized protein n=1 Tax=Zizania palustris TaxID=103762 RepID=A0A8J5T733_ZIZPA|nr:hypothetical protein GUJ93_ZPchr0006g45967 [Zizania palustris]